MEGNKKQGTPALRVLELFAGVGGFRFGLNEVKNDAGNAFEVVWANQFEPSTNKDKEQRAAKVYRARWGGQDLVNEDICKVLDDEAAMARIDALCPDMLVGGFPCQDYSVAKPLGRSEGLQGDKGVLWWAIHRLLQGRNEAGAPIKYLMLENVDRLLSSPATCPGRDYAVILSSLQSLGYAVEWRVINAADYGHAQKRRRVFIMAYHQSTALYQKLVANVQGQASDWLLASGVMARALPAQLKAKEAVSQFELPVEVYEAQTGYTPILPQKATAKSKGKTRFASGGVCFAGQVWTAQLQAQMFMDYTPFTGQRQALTLGDIVRGTAQAGQTVAETFFLKQESLSKWEVAKGAKKKERIDKDGKVRPYSEGKMDFPDRLNGPGRTIITSEGGAGVSRCTHVIAHEDGRLRRLLPEELEAMNGFSRGFTNIPGITPAQRAFLMGNALVTGLVTRLGEVLSAEHAADTPPEGSIALEGSSTVVAGDQEVTGKGEQGQRSLENSLAAAPQAVLRDPAPPRDLALNPFVQAHLLAKQAPANHVHGCHQAVPKTQQVAAAWSKPLRLHGTPWQYGPARECPVSMGIASLQANVRISRKMRNFLKLGKWSDFLRRIRGSIRNVSFQSIQQQLYQEHQRSTTHRGVGRLTSGVP